jgi:hypothetical protein
MASADIQLQGHIPAFRDAKVLLRNQVTGATIERKPFLDGTLRVADIEPGPYQLEVTHPNLVSAIDRRLIRVFDQPTPTRIPIPVPADLFRDTPIRDIPDADLGPVQQAVTSTRDRVRPIAGKASGEVIRASDWNTLAGAVADLAGAVLELTHLVAPRGHDHPEIAEKIGEVQENLRRFAEAYGRSLLELRREIESENIRQTVTDVLDAGAATAEIRTRVLERVGELDRAVLADTTVFTQKLTTTGSLLLTTINDLAVAQGAGADEFLQKPEVQKVRGMAQQYMEAGTQTRPESELMTYQRTTTAAGGKLGQLVRK